MKLLLDAFWRAGMYCLMPRVIAMSVLPLVLVIGGTVAFMYFFSAPIIAGIDAWMRSYIVYDTAMNWLRGAGLGMLQHLLAHILLLMVTTPLLVLITLLLVNLMATPMVASLVVERRFPGLQRRTGLTFPGSLLWTLWSFLLAFIVLVLTSPLWLIPPFILSFFIPPLVWGWFSYRVSSYDVLVNYCTRATTKEIFRQHRSWLLLIGVASAFLGAIPSFGSLFLLGVLDPVTFFLVVMPISIWLYTLVFMFSALWFAHYCIAAVADHHARPPADAKPGLDNPPALPHPSARLSDADARGKPLEQLTLVDSAAVQPAQPDHQ